jgi:pyruvate dehydrogenase E2 component (dihydrolipoamide acetyltransferase)
MLAGAIQYPLRAAGTISRVVQWGTCGSVVLFLHGLGSHAGVWSKVAPMLASGGLRCIAVDLPGHGLASKGAGFRYDLEGHIDWLAALIEGLDEPRVDLVASSLGGLWAAGFAARYAARIRSLTLVGAIGLEPLTLERRRWTADYLTRMDRDSIAERLRRAVADPAAIDDRFVEEVYRMNNSAGAAEAFDALGRYYLEGINQDLQLEPLMSRSPAFPLLLVWGSDDVTVPCAGAAAAATLIPGCTLLTLPATRHVPHLERPQDVVLALAGHVAAGSRA